MDDLNLMEKELETEIAVTKDNITVWEKEPSMELCFNKKIKMDMPINKKIS